MEKEDEIVSMNFRNCNFFSYVISLQLTFHLPVHPLYPEGTRAGTWCFLEGEFLLSLIDSVQPSGGAMVGHSEILHFKSTCIYCRFLPRSLNKTLIHLVWKFLLSFPCLLIPYCCCLQNCDKMINDFLSACSTNPLDHSYLCNGMLYRVRLFS